jgi:hypothetical protein
MQLLKKIRSSRNLFQTDPIQPIIKQEELIIYNPAIDEITL